MDELKKYYQLKEKLRNEYKKDLNKRILEQVKINYKMVKKKNDFSAFIVIDDLSILSQFSFLLTNSVLLKIHRKESLVKLNQFGSVIRLERHDNLESIRLKTQSPNDFLSLLPEDVNCFCLYTHLLMGLEVNPLFLHECERFVDQFYLQDIACVAEHYYLLVYSDEQSDSVIQDHIPKFYFIYGGITYAM